MRLVLILSKLVKRKQNIIYTEIQEFTNEVQNKMVKNGFKKYLKYINNQTL